MNKNGDSQCVCIDYRNNKDCDILFLDCGKIITHVNYENLQRGSFKSPYSKSILNIGYIGIGDGFAERPKEYTLWNDMLNRCYNTRLDRRRDVNYHNCYVSEEWHNFQNFLIWYDQNIQLYKVDEPITLDKDLQYKGNKIYSKYSCLLLPERVNIFLTTSKHARGKFPIGVFFENDSQKYKAQCCDPLNRYGRNIGRFNSPEEAFLKYKITKEKYANDLAEYYKNKIDERAINSLKNYKVEITD